MLPRLRAPVRGDLTSEPCRPLMAPPFSTPIDCSATTHTDLWLRAKEMGIETRVIHNASIMNAVGACGLQLYSFGQTVSIPYFREDWQPDSWYDKVAANKAVPTAGCCTAAASAGASSGSSAADASALATPDGLHTLCLLDIKVREPNFEAMVRTGRTVYDPPRFMSINEAIEQMLLIEARRGLGLCGPSALAVGVARVGQDSQKIVSGTLAELVQVDFGGPLHSLVLCGGMHELEWAMWRAYRWDGSGPKWVKPAPASSSSRSRSSSEGSQGR